ncbi:MAG: ComF family protein [Bacteroidota bacterium]|nr:ComF family protein [Bacteroidota bacterium]
MRSHDDPRNRVEQLFFGRIPLHAASSYLLFNRSGVVQRMLHRLKYKHDLDLGIELGCMMANDLKGSERFQNIDGLLAVPIHKRKEHQRGYNQSQVLVDGMKKVLDLPSVHGSLVRIEGTSSQTKLGRLARWKNVKDAFWVKDPEKLRDKHIMLIDDVVTTGATIESCALALNEVPGIRISLYTAACA